MLLTELLLVPALLIGVVFHEAGHWLVCVLLGVPALSVQVGGGRVVLRRRVGTTALELRRLQIGGVVHHGLLLPIGRMAHILICLGGPLGNVAVIGLVALATYGLGTARMDPVAPGIVMAQMLIIATSLFPWRGRSGKSDGYQLVETLFRGIAPTIAACRDYYARQLQPYRGADDPPVAFSKASCRVFYERSRLEMPEERVDAAQALLAELDRGEVATDEALLILDALIRRQVLHRDLGLGPRLDELSARASRLSPDNAHIRVSRGAALLELGRRDEGEATLAPLTHGAASFAKVMALEFLARDAEKRRDAADACRLIDAAIETVQACDGAPDLVTRLRQAKEEIAPRDSGAVQG